MQRPTLPYVQLLHLILHRFRPGSSRTLEMFVGDLKVMLGRYRLTVTYPNADNMQGKLLSQFRLTGAAKILK